MQASKEGAESDAERHLCAERSETPAQGPGMGHAHGVSEREPPGRNVAARYQLATHGKLALGPATSSRSGKTPRVYIYIVRIVASDNDIRKPTARRPRRAIFRRLPRISRGALGWSAILSCVGGADHGCSPLDPV
jgi:hypothetical protein